MEWFNTWTLILLVLLLLVVYWYVSIPKNLPPGPIGFPLLGYALFIRGDLHKAFNDLGEKFGKIYHLYLGSQLVIVLNDYDVIKEAFIKQKNNFAGRPKITHNAGFLNEFFQGISINDGEYSKQHRSFLYQNFKQNGFGKSTLEPLIMIEIHHFLKEVDNYNGKPFKFQKLCALTMANNIQLLVSGQRYDYNDPRQQILARAIKEGSDGIVKVIKLFIAFPWAKPFLKIGFKNKIKEGREISEEANQIIKASITDLKDKFVYGQTDTYHQAFLTERETRLRINSKDNLFSEQGLVFITRDILVAGIETTSTTLTWGIMYLAAYPEVQKKVQQEIDQVIGRNREPTFSDRLNTPYTEATILEIHRFSTVVPNSIPRRIVKSTTLLGYNLPENAIVFPNLWAVHHDPKLWGDPENFRPERFLNSNGECVKPDYLIPFSIGVRACPGQPLLVIELYLYLVCLLQQFNFVGPNDTKPSLEAIHAAILGPKSDLMCIEARKD